MLRYVVDEILSKSFDYFLKDKRNERTTTTTTTTKKQSKLNRNENSKSSKIFLRGVFNRSTSVAKLSGEQDLTRETIRHSTDNSLFDELDWFSEFRKG